jgi:hypothetical protein
VFAAADPFCGVDLDDCVDPATGQLKPWGQEIVTRLASYTEVSPSGNGVKVFLRAKKPGPRCRKPYADGEVEIYDVNRFFTVTGRRLPESPTDVEDCQIELEAVYRQVFGEDDDNHAGALSPVIPKPSGNGHAVAQLADDDIIRLASKQRRTGDKFSDLWSGRWNDYFNSPSEADSSVIFTLAYYTKDAAQLDRLFRQSGPMRAKWDEKHGDGTYGQMTVAKALEKVTRQYEPRNATDGRNGRYSKIPRPAAPVPINPDLPAIIVDDMQLSDLTAKALDAVDQSNDPPSVFVRSGTPSRIVCDEKGIPAIEPLDRIRMRCRLAEVANFFSLRKGKDGYERVGINPPLSLAENILALGSWTFPQLSGIVRSPILHRDGTICTRPGYDPASGLVYCPDPGLTLTPIIEYPNQSEIEACVDLLLDRRHGTHANHGGRHQGVESAAEAEHRPCDDRCPAEDHSIRRRRGGQRQDRQRA